MKLIAEKPEENAVIANLAKELRDKNIYADVVNYEDGFGLTVWSVDDLECISETQEWTQEEKIRCMEYADRKLGGATEDSWERLKSLAADYIDERKKNNIAYVDANYYEIDKTKFYLDVCGGGWVRMVYYNPDSDAGGQFVENLISDYDISEAGKTCADEDEFWTYLYANSRQTLVDIDTYLFNGYAKDFVESTCDYDEQTAETIEGLKQWAEKSIKTEGENYVRNP